MPEREKKAQLYRTIRSIPQPKTIRYKVAKIRVFFFFLFFLPFGVLREGKEPSGASLEINKGFLHI